MDMRYFILGLAGFIFAAFAVYAPASFAQSSQPIYRPYQQQKKKPPVKESMAADILYNNAAQNLIDGRSAKFNYMNLRGLYYQTRQYDPLGEETVRKIQDLAYNVQSTENFRAIDEALAQYNGLLKAHIANLAVVSQAIALAKQDTRFGDAQFLTRVRRGLFDSVIHSGDGMTLDGAYDVITMDEEVLLLSHLNYEVLTTKLVKTGIIYYNMHYVVERETQNPYAIFVNVTFPMKRLEAQRTARGTSVEVPKR